MGAKMKTQTNDTPENGLGPKIGTLRTASELVEIGICVASLLVWAGLWRAGVVVPSMVIVGSISTVVVLFLFSKALGGAWHIYDQGVAIRHLGRSLTFSFTELTSIVAKQTAYYQKRVYVGTKMELTLTMARRPELTFKTDYRKDTEKERIAQTLVRRCSEGVQQRLFADLQQRGEIYWTQNVYLTPNGLKITDASAEPRLIPFDDVEELKMADNALKIWRAGDALPILQMSNDAKNFVPLFGLFQNLTASSHAISQQAEPLADVSLGGAVAEEKA